MELVDSIRRRLACPKRISVKLSMKVLPVRCRKKRLKDTSDILASLDTSASVIFLSKFLFRYSKVRSTRRLLYVKCSVVKDRSERMRMLREMDRSCRIDISSSTESKPCF